MSDAAYAHCEALVRASDQDRFVASLFAPTGTRPHLFALYAFNLEIARVAEVAQAPLAGEIRLQWWYDALTGAGHGEVAGHPVANAVLDTLDRCRLSTQPLLDLIEARRSDLYQEPIATSAEFDSYVRRTSSGLFATAARIVAWNGHELADAADAAGLAYGTTTLLAVAPLHASSGHVYVPSEVLDRHGAGAADLLAGRATPALTEALAELIARAERDFGGFLARSPAAAGRAAGIVTGRDRAAPIEAVAQAWTWRAVRRRGRPARPVDGAPAGRLVRFPAAVVKGRGLGLQDDDVRVQHPI
jgi:phytoene synthase